MNMLWIYLAGVMTVLGFIKGAKIVHKDSKKIFNWRRTIVFLLGSWVSFGGLLAIYFILEDKNEN